MANTHVHGFSFWYICARYWNWNIKLFETHICLKKPFIFIQNTDDKLAYFIDIYFTEYLKNMCRFSRYFLSKC